MINFLIMFICLAAHPPHQHRSLSTSFSLDSPNKRIFAFPVLLFSDIILYPLPLCHFQCVTAQTRLRRGEWVANGGKWIDVWNVSWIVQLRGDHVPHDALLPPKKHTHVWGQAYRHAIVKGESQRQDNMITHVKESKGYCARSRYRLQNMGCVPPWCGLIL